MKGMIRQITSVTIAMCLIMSFSIPSFAVAYDFVEVGDADHKSFSGNNKVYTNGVHVGGSGSNIVMDSVMENSNNTYTGTNTIDATAYPADSYDTGSTYNGTLAVTANDISTGVNTVNNATVNASTTVNANELLSSNNLNAGVAFNSSTFNNDVTLSGSGQVNLAGSTVNNLVLGNIPQMQTLIDLVGSFRGLFIDYAVACSESDPLSKTVSIKGYDVQVRRYHIIKYVYNTNTHELSTGGYWAYFTIPSWLFDLIDNFKQSLLAMLLLLNDHWNMYWEAYLPNKDLAQAQYWIAYNTDTDSYDSVNLATVFGYITWYLGQMYIQGNEAATDITQSVTNLSDTLTNFETQETSINNSIKSSLDTVDSFFSLPAITTAGTVLAWLQYMWVSLADYQAVTYFGWALIILTIVTGFYKVKRITV